MGVLLRVIDSYAKRPDPTYLDGLHHDLEIHAKPLNRVRDLHELRPSGSESGESHVTRGTADGLKVNVNGSPVGKAGRPYS